MILGLQKFRLRLEYKHYREVIGNFMLMSHLSGIFAFRQLPTECRVEIVFDHEKYPGESLH